MDAVREAWQRIERWLAEHASATLASLNPPADPAQVAAAEAELGVSFPADLVASFARHDGVTRGWGDAWYTQFRFRRTIGRSRSASWWRSGGGGWSCW
jgi:cell wall assembly regulator SMI1